MIFSPSNLQEVFLVQHLLSSTTSAEVKTQENQEALERVEESKPSDGSQNTSVQGTTSQAKTHCRARNLMEAPENSTSKIAS